MIQIECEIPMITRQQIANQFSVVNFRTVTEVEKPINKNGISPTLTLVNLDFYANLMLKISRLLPNVEEAQCLLESDLKLANPRTHIVDITQSYILTPSHTPDNDYVSWYVHECPFEKVIDIERITVKNLNNISIEKSLIDLPYNTLKEFRRCTTEYVVCQLTNLIPSDIKFYTQTINIFPYIHVTKVV